MVDQNTIAHPEAEVFARIIWQATMSAWEMCLGGDSYPNKRDRYERMKNPQAGDMVVEVSGGLRKFDCAMAVGWFEREAREPIEIDEWDVEADGPIPTERVVYMTSIDGRACRWVNCTFIQTPTYSGWWDNERRRDEAAQALEKRNG